MVKNYSWWRNSFPILSGDLHHSPQCASRIIPFTYSTYSPESAHVTHIISLHSFFFARPYTLTLSPLCQLCQFLFTCAYICHVCVCPHILVYMYIYIYLFLFAPFSLSPLRNIFFTYLHVQLNSRRQCGWTEWRSMTFFSISYFFFRCSRRGGSCILPVSSSLWTSNASGLSSSTVKKSLFLYISILAARARERGGRVIYDRRKFVLIRGIFCANSKRRLGIHSASKRESPACNSGEFNRRGCRYVKLNFAGDHSCMSTESTWTPWNYTDLTDAS